MRDDIDVKKLKGRLEDELEKLTTELESVGRVNPDNKADWEAKSPQTGSVDNADANLRADHIEEYEVNTAVLKELETRFNNVKIALKKIEDGVYGNCEVAGKPIEAARLDANPAARTCIEHLRDLEE